MLQQVMILQSWLILGQKWNKMIEIGIWLDHITVKVFHTLFDTLQKDDNAHRQLHMIFLETWRPENYQNITISVLA